MKYLLTIFLFISVFCSLQSSGQTKLGNEFLYTLTKGPFVFKYLIYYPEDYNSTTKKYPVAIFFQGVGETPLDNKGRVNHDTILFEHGIADQIEHNNYKPPFIVITTQTPVYNSTQINGWDFSNQSHVDWVLDDAFSKLRVDYSHIYMTGLSAGGDAILNYNADKVYNPKYRIAAIAPMSAAIDTTTINYKRIADSSLPVWGFGSDPGDVFGIITHRIIANINLLKPGLGAWTNFNGSSHACCWQKGYDPSSGLYNWMLSKTVSVKQDTSTTIPADTTHQDTVIVTPPTNPHVIVTTKNAGNDVVLNNYKIAPGDYVLIPDGVNVVWWNYYKGDSLNKVRILPANKTANNVKSFNFVGCTGFRITGFNIAGDNTGAAFSFTGRTANIQVDSNEVHNKGTGIWCKIETADDKNADSLRYPNWWIHDLFVQDNTFENIVLEGAYIGSTAPFGTKFSHHGSVYWNGILDTSMPPRLYNIKFLHNKYRRIGRAPIQIAAAEFGDNEILYNDIDSVGSDPDREQGNGISVGSCFHGSIKYNKIRHTKKDAIQCTSISADVEYNDIDFAGNSAMGLTSQAGAVYIVSQKVFPTSKADTITTFIVKYNSFGSSNTRKDTGLYVETGYGTYASTNKVIGNTGGYYIRPGIKFQTSEVIVPDSILVFVKRTRRIKKDTLILPVAYRITQLISGGIIYSSKADTLYNKQLIRRDTTYDTTWKRVVDTLTQAKKSFAPIAIPQGYSSPDEMNFGVLKRLSELALLRGVKSKYFISEDL